MNQMPRPTLDSKELPDFSGLSFFVVEDDRDSRGFLGELLRACGGLVVEAEHVRAAKAFVGTMKFDLVITDLAMPGEDGAIFLKWLRQQPRGQGDAVPAVAVTACDPQRTGSSVTEGLTLKRELTTVVVARWQLDLLDPELALLREHRQHRGHGAFGQPQLSGDVASTHRPEALEDRTYIAVDLGPPAVHKTPPPMFWMGHHKATAAGRTTHESFFLHGVSKRRIT
jgi:CheY-like chemotaxis protein